MHKKTSLSILFCFISFFISNQEIFAQTKLSVQGVMRKSDGNAVDDGFYDVTFKLYDAATNGTLLWTEAQTGIKVTSGIYSTLLGTVTPLDLPFDEYYYLSLTIEGEELIGRAPLSSAPYTNSLIGSDNIFPSTGNVGIGTLTPTSKLQVNGNTSLGGNASITGSLNVSGLPLYVNASNIGMGTTSPTERLQVEGRIRVSDAVKIGTTTNYTGDGLTVVGNSISVRANGPTYGSIRFGDTNTGFQNSWAGIEGYSATGGDDVAGLIFYTSYGARGERMRINQDGLVGIGTGSPSHRLHVIGTAGLSTGTAWTNTSDIRLKENIRPYKRGLSDILKIKPVYYTYTEASGLKNDEKYGQNIGIIAQELETIIPEAITTAPLTLKDGSVMPDAKQLVKADAIWFAFINAFKEQQEQIKTLQDENQALKKAMAEENASLSAKLEELDRAIKKLNAEVSLND